MFGSIQTGFADRLAIRFDEKENYDNSGVWALSKQ